MLALEQSPLALHPGALERHLHVGRQAARLLGEGVQDRHRRLLGRDRAWRATMIPALPAAPKARAATVRRVSRRRRGGSGGRPRLPSRHGEDAPARSGGGREDRRRPPWWPWCSPPRHLARCARRARPPRPPGAHRGGRQAARARPRAVSSGATRSPRPFDLPARAARRRAHRRAPCARPGGAPAGHAGGVGGPPGVRRGLRRAAAPAGARVPRRSGRRARRGCPRPGRLAPGRRCAGALLERRRALGLRPGAAHHAGAGGGPQGGPRRRHARGGPDRRGPARAGRVRGASRAGRDRASREP